MGAIGFCAIQQKYSPSIRGNNLNQFITFDNLKAKLLKMPLVQKEILCEESGARIKTIITRKYVQDRIVENSFKLNSPSTLASHKHITIMNFFQPVTLSNINFVILTLKCYGMSNPEIARRIYRAESTVRNVAQEILDMFNVDNYVTLSKYYEFGEWLDKNSTKILEKFLIKSV